MALIAMAVHDTEENGRSKLTQATIESIYKTVNWKKHRLIISDNKSYKKTKDLYVRIKFLLPDIKIIFNPENVGTAKAINQAWRQRKPCEHCIKIYNDVVVRQVGWVEEMEAAIAAEPQIGIVGLKRKDLWQYPDNPDRQYKSELIMLPHKSGEPWIVVEKTKDIMGTCVMINSALIDKIGYLYQPNLYGYDDVLYSYRSNIAWFINVFLPHIHIDHIDPGGTEYCDWKRKESGEVTQQVIKLVDEYMSGKTSIYYE